MSYTFLLLGLVFLPIYSKTPTPTLENLNTVYLWPSVHKVSIPQKLKTIPEWFEKIKQDGFPLQGFVSCPARTSQPLWQFQKGVPAGFTEPIFIHSSPRDATLDRMINGRTGHSFRCTNSWIKNEIINGPVITFDYFFDTKDFDFGQGVNVNCLQLIYKELIEKNPQAPLIIASTCIGAKIALEFAATYNTAAIKAMILESPFIDVAKVARNWADNYVYWLPFLSTSSKASLIKSTLSWCFPYCTAFYKPHADLTHIHSELPIFITHLYNDSFYSNKDIFDLIQMLKKSGNKNIYLLVIKDKKLTHGHLNNKKAFIIATNAFLAKYNLPHNKLLAQRGEDLLARAQQNAQASNPMQWYVIESA